MCVWYMNILYAVLCTSPTMYIPYPFHTSTPQKPHTHLVPPTQESTPSSPPPPPTTHTLTPPTTPAITWLPHETLVQRQALTVVLFCLGSDGWTYNTATSAYTAAYTATSAYTQPTADTPTTPHRKTTVAKHIKTATIGKTTIGKTPTHSQTATMGPIEGVSGAKSAVRKALRLLASAPVLPGLGDVVLTAAAPLWSCPLLLPLVQVCVGMEGKGCGVVCVGIQYWYVILWYFVHDGGRKGVWGGGKNGCRVYCAYFVNIHTSITCLSIPYLQISPIARIPYTYNTHILHTYFIHSTHILTLTNILTHPHSPSHTFSLTHTGVCRSATGVATARCGFKTPTLHHSSNSTHTL